MMRTWLLALLSVLVVAGQANAQQTPPRRQALEQQVMQRFLQRVVSELELPAAARPQLARVIQQTGAERRALNQRAALLRRTLVQAVEDPATSDAQFEQLLDDLRALRVQEQELWQREQERLQQILTPRQLAHFSLLWLRLQEDARAVMQQRGGRMQRLP